MTSKSHLYNHRSGYTWLRVSSELQSDTRQQVLAPRPAAQVKETTHVDLRIDIEYYIRNSSDDDTERT